MNPCALKRGELPKKTNKDPTWRAQAVYSREPVPVHPALARVLAAWKPDGWPRLYGRAPTPDDLISPGPAGTFLTDKQVRLALYNDLELLGLRRRRTHDSRRTFISLAQADGAHKDILRWVTHGPEGDIVNLYTTLPWPALREEVAKLRIHLPGAPKAAPEVTEPPAQAVREPKMPLPRP